MAHKERLSGDPEEIKAELRREFPGWSIIYTRDSHRWWASRAPLVAERLNGDAVDADTAEGLRSRLAAKTNARGDAQ